MSSGGYVPQDPNGYDEPDPAGPGVNRTFTDYAEQPSVKQNRTQAFKEGHGR
jgi:hypothetical protein